jgi:hypothetical protein
MTHITGLKYGKSLKKRIVHILQLAITNHISNV